MIRLKTFLVWLLLLTLPLQGFASVSQAMCDSVPAMVIVPEQPAQPPHAASADATGGDHCKPPSATSKCSTCAACCVGAAIVCAFAPVPGLPAVGSEPIPYIATHVTANVPGGLERPPHSLIA